MENFYTTVQTTTGDVVNGATVTVYDASSGLPATIYEPDGVTPLSNPFLSGYARNEGEIEFGAANGQYNIEIVNGAETDWIYRITLLDAAGALLGDLAYQDDASGVPIIDAGGYYTSTEVEGALQEAGADLAAHLADTLDAHDASAISVLDAGGLFIATDVEEALQELKLDTPNYQYFTENRNTAAPNATIPVHQWVADGAETNIDAALTQKGTGAILAQVPDGTAVGGNKRGTYAVDWQLARLNATEIALGPYSVINGGRDNTCGATYASCGGGYGNDVSSQAGCIPGGIDATTRTTSGKYAYSAGKFSAKGDAQEGKAILRIQTTSATPAKLTALGGSVIESNVVVIPDNHAYTIVATITARDTSTGDMASWIVKGAAKRATGVATTALVGTPSIETISMDAGASTWAVSLVANTTLGSADIQVTGEAATTIHWVCKFETVEVG